MIRSGLLDWRSIGSAASGSPNRTACRQRQSNGRLLRSQVRRFSRYRTPIPPHVTEHNGLPAARRLMHMGIDKEQPDNAGRKTKYQVDSASVQSAPLMICARTVTAARADDNGSFAAAFHQKRCNGRTVFIRIPAASGAPSGHSSIIWSVSPAT